MKDTTIDLEISEETEIKLTIVRRILYKLHDAGIATCKKAKDPKTNWDMYVWNLEEVNILNGITKNMKIYQQISKNPYNMKKRTCYYSDDTLDIAIS